MLSISIRQIEYAVAVLEYGGVAAAAAKLNVSQPALSVAISNLEQHLGKSLFSRKKGSAAKPTVFGKNFLEESRKILWQFGALLEGDGIELKRPINIGCFVDLAPLVLAPVMAGLKQLYPYLIITPRIGEFEFLKDELQVGRLDFAITYNLGLGQGYEYQEVSRLKPHILIDENHVFVDKKEVKLKDLINEDFVLTDQELSVNHMMSLFHQFGTEMKISHRVPTLETMRSFVANGMGVGLSYTKPKPDMSYDGKRLVCLEISDYSAEEPIIIARDKNHTSNETITRLINDAAIEIDKLSRIG